MELNPVYVIMNGDKEFFKSLARGLEYSQIHFQYTSRKENARLFHSIEEARAVTTILNEGLEYKDGRNKNRLSIFRVIEQNSYRLEAVK